MDRNQFASDSLRHLASPDNANSLLRRVKTRLRERCPFDKKGKLTGAKPPLRPKHVWSIQTKLQIAGRTRDLAMFNLAIDSKLRGCDVVALKADFELSHHVGMETEICRIGLAASADDGHSIIALSATGYTR
jgi:hypothetical protein